MPLQAKSISVSVAVICFFGIALVGWISGLLPLTCCKRALIAAVVAYAATAIAIKAINSILIDAMIKNQMNQQQRKNSGSGD